MSETGPHLITDDDTSSSTSAASASSSEATSNTTTQRIKKEPLPLGWTQVTRKRKTPDDSSNDDDNKNHHWWNCTDPNCERPPPSFAAPAQTKTLKQNSKKDPDSLLLQGTAIFCLPDLNPSWMQGYLFPTSGSSSKSKKPYRLLAVQDHDLDECLQCADGGYRQVSLTVIGSNKTNNTNNTKRRHVIPQIDWTGGDMMRWTTPDGRVHFEPHQLATDAKAIPYMRKYFQALVDQVSKVSSCTDDDDDDNDEPSKTSSSSSCKDNDTVDILELLPQVAIVTGTMTVRLPIQNEE